MLIKVLVVLTGVCFGVIAAKSAGLSPQQEHDVVKYINYEISQCKIYDKSSLNKCLKDLAVHLKPYMSYGLKVWDVPVLEPLYLEDVSLSRGNSETKLDARFSDVYVFGMSNFTLTHVESYPEEFRYEFKIVFPSIKILGMYEIHGKLILMELNDRGPFYANLTNVEATVENNFKVNNGVLDLYKVKSDFNFHKISFHLDNLLRGSPLGESVNEALNEDSDVLFKELKPGFVKEINKITLKTLRRGLQVFPLDRWLSAIPK